MTSVVIVDDETDFVEALMILVSSLSPIFWCSSKKLKL